MATWSISDEMDNQGRKDLSIQKGNKKITVKMNENDADKLIRFFLRKFND